MSERPAALVGLNRKGHIALGYDADFAVFAPDEAWLVDPSRLRHKNPVTPYAGRPVAGVVRSTWLRGEEVTGQAPRGRLLSRGGV
jgi:allantoinase